MKIILSNCIEIREPTKEIVNFVKKELTFKNPNYEKKRRLGFYAYGEPKTIKLYDIYQDKVFVPIGCFNSLFKEHPIPSDYIDYSVEVKANIKSDIKLRDYQELAIPSVLNYKTGILNLPVGLGKTELALECVNRVGQKTIWLTHTGDLLNQSKSRCEAKMTCKTSTITEGRCDLTGDIVFATVQTLYKYVQEEKIPQNTFGMLIMDECFPSGTKISTPNGYKNIENIEMGDIVYSYNHEKNCLEEKEVDYLFNKKVDYLIRLTLETGNVISCTPNHPIYNGEKYVRADKLSINDKVRLMDGAFVNIKSMKRWYCDNEEMVYNIGVKDNHNYFANNILVHNCHHLVAKPDSIQIFRSCVDYFACKYKIGLTATVHRADGLVACMKAIIGDVIYKIEQQGNDYVCIYENKELLRFPLDAFQVPAMIKVLETSYNVIDKPVYASNGGTIQFATLISNLAMDEKRNKELVRILKSISGSTLVLSDRVEQLKYLCSQVEGGVEIDGSTPKKQRIKALEDVSKGAKKYLFASYNLAKEGLSVDILSNLVMATPVKDFAIVSQSIGRIQRPYKDKKIAVVYDLVDDVGMLYGFFIKRRSTYRKKGWKIENIYLGGNK